MRRLVLLVPLFFIIGLNAQTNKRLDSLIETSKSQKQLQLVKTLNEISWEFRNSNADSAILYAKKSIRTANRQNDDKAIASAYNSLAAGFEAKSELDSAEIFHQKSLKLKIKANDTIGVADSYNNLGILLDTKGNYPMALENYFKALTIYDNHSRDFDKVPMVFINIGIVYKKQKEYQKALSYYQKALKIYKLNNYKVGEVIITGNIGSLMLSLKEYATSLEYSKKALRLYDSLGYNRYVPYMQVNMATAHDSLGNYKEARKEYLECISAFKKDENKYELAHAKIGLAQNYIKSKETEKAKSELKEALAIIIEKDFRELEIKAYKYLAKVELQSRNFESAYTYFEKYAIGKDSLFEKEKTQTIFELETRYDTEKKEKEILSQRADIAEKELDLSKKNYYILGLVAVAVVLILLGILIYNQQKLKNRQLQRENELKDALIKIETQSRLQEQRLRISRDLHDNIGAQLTFIISSLDNLKFSFQLPDKLNSKLKTISEFTTTTIYELRDTIWAMNKNEISIEDLQTRLSNFIEKANAVTESVNLQLEMGDEFPNDLKFSSVEGMNIYRIIQEAINNSLKYADANLITVQFVYELNTVKIKILDIGNGFDLNTIELGNGINNMKKRAQELNGKFSIQTELHQGTTISLMMPLSKIYDK